MEQERRESSVEKKGRMRKGSDADVEMNSAFERNFAGRLELSPDSRQSPSFESG